MKWMQTSKAHIKSQKCDIRLVITKAFSCSPALLKSVFALLLVSMEVIMFAFFWKSDAKLENHGEISQGTRSRSRDNFHHFIFN